MRKETAGWLTAILTCVLLTGCGSQAAGAARTAAAIESQAGSTEEIADHSEEKAEKPRVVLQQEEMGKETERSESEATAESSSAYAFELRDLYTGEVFAHHDSPDGAAFTLHNPTE